MKTIAPFFLALLSLQSVFGQTEWGIHTGGGISDIVLVNEPDVTGISFSDEEYQPKPSVLIGIYSSFSLFSKTNLVAGLQYTNKGARIDNSFGSTSQLNLHYVSIPVLVRYHPFNQWFIEVGPEIARLIASGSGSNTFDWYEPFDIGINGGLGYHFSEKWSTALRYYLGLSNVWTDLQLTDTQGNLIDHDMKLQNRFMQLSLIRSMGTF
ncbi:porin family protein [Tunicatimonas pelagia]|uniref:porin family protein n=1 Tax=Tunicatimonas pelagia TaxID=931531 RepID=UPI0026651AE7|nr:porin family protein [Tunicatimonas pelagia]WKN44009.1 porin family protein [Tunicatimonas pelagia]